MPGRRSESRVRPLRRALFHEGPDSPTRREAPAFRRRRAPRRRPGVARSRGAFLPHPPGCGDAQRSGGARGEMVAVYLPIDRSRVPVSTTRLTMPRSRASGRSQVVSRQDDLLSGPPHQERRHRGGNAEPDLGGTPGWPRPRRSQIPHDRARSRPLPRQLPWIPAMVG